MSRPDDAVPFPMGGSKSAATWRWTAALVLGIAAMALRVALEPWLEGSVPFVFAFPAVVLSALLSGAAPGLLTIAVCALAPFVPGMPDLLVDGRSLQQVSMFVLSALAVVAACAWLMRRLPTLAGTSLQGAAMQDAALQDVSLADPGRHAQIWLRVLIYAALLLPTVFFVSAAWQARRVAMSNAEERVTRGAIIAREHALKIVHMDGLIFDTMEARFDGRSAADIDAHAPQMQAALAEMVRGLPDVQSLIVWGRDGRLLLDSQPLSAAATKLDGNGREYFRMHRDHAGLGPYLSTPIESRTFPGVWRIVVSQRRVTADGAFDGVYAIVLQPNVFNNFYHDLLRNEHSGTVALFRNDGSVVVREPPPATPGPIAPTSSTMMDHLRAGDTEGIITVQSLVDARERLVAFRKLPGYPLYVSASVARDAILAGWHRELALLAAFTFPTALALAWVSWAALGHTRRERLALDRWRAETVKRAQVEDALRQTQRLEALGHLTGGVAHDVNNLLMVVSNNAYLLRRLLSSGVPAGAKTEKPIDAILRAVTTGARLTRQLLAFSRRQALRPEVLNLTERLPLLLDLMRHSISAMVSLDGEAAADTDFILVDPAELELALINLAVNARDAMPDGGRLRVEMRNATTSEHQGLGRWVSITVRDSGGGIPSDVLEHVFEPFFTTKEQGKGTGLGLSQVYGFCQQAGGTARVESTVGVGTMVQLLLPAANGMPESAEELPPVPAADGRLLLVEDNAEVAEATEPMLSSWGYAVRSARSGDAAKDLLQSATGGFELLLTDIVMPGATDGLTLARHVRGLYPHIGIVLMTGHARETDKAMAEGFVVLQKPWTPQALASALEEAHPRKRVAV